MLKISGGFKGGGGAIAPYWLIFFSKSRFFSFKMHISWCAFAINEDGAEKLSFAPPSKILDPLLLKISVHR